MLLFNDDDLTLAFFFQPIKENGKFWVSMLLNGFEYRRFGPFTARTVEAETDRLAREWRERRTGMRSPATQGRALEGLPAAQGRARSD
jgi:hypothetical protein